jgi:hypothetical protein
MQNWQLSLIPGPSPSEGDVTRLDLMISSRHGGKDSMAMNEEHMMLGRASLRSGFDELGSFAKYLNM